MPRTGPKSDWEWSLELVAYGRGGQARTVEEARLKTDENRIEYDRGGLVEWYENSPRGLKQGFKLWVRPEHASGAPVPRQAIHGTRSAVVVAEDRSDLVHLDMRLGGSLLPVTASDGQAVDFRTARGINKLHFAGLLVTDADGRELPAWMEGFTGAGFGGLRIVFEDTDAAYPVTIDPLATSPSWTAESDQADAWFGNSVGTAGDVNGDGYTDVIVGALAFDNGEADEGRAYVYHGSASGLSTTAAWTAESDQASARFGDSVGTAGDVNGDGYADVIIGASVYDNGEFNEGRAYVFHGSASGLASTAVWTAESDQVSSFFGGSVGPAGDVNGDGYADVIVGASSYDNGEADEGRAFVYHGSASGLELTAAWTAESDQALARFGESVGTAGDVNGDGYADVVVGAYFFDNGEPNEGRAFVYHGSASGLALTAAWTAEGDQLNAEFGTSVGTAGDVNRDGYADVIVGAEFFDNGEVDEGRAFVYYGSGSGLSTAADWTAENNWANSRFGFSVGTAGDINGNGYTDVIIGAYNIAKDEEQAGEGAAYVYQGSASGLATTAAWTGEGNQANANFGRSVGTAGDINGDGYADIIVGAYRYDNGESNEGRAFVYNGSVAGLTTTAAWSVESDQGLANLGFSSSTAGDVNGDGYDDVIVGAHFFDNGQMDEGRAYVYHGSDSGLSGTPDWTVESDQANANFGYSVGSSGDVNGDGYTDVIVGAYTYDNGEADEGRAFVYQGSVLGLSTAAAWTAESNQASAEFGISVGTAGDVNGDGYADVIVGADMYDNGQPNEGRAYVYHGSILGLNTSAAWTGESDQAGGQFGNSVGTAGDVNGDGYTDIIAGAYTFDTGLGDEGRAYVYHGSSSGLNLTADWFADNNQTTAQFGGSVGTAGDVNGDGYADVIIGARLYDNGEANEGRAYVYLGSTTGLEMIAAWTAESDQANADFGRSVGTAGDINGDGYADVIVGAPLYDNFPVDEGRAFVYEGSTSGLSISSTWTAESEQLGAQLGISVGTAGDVNGDGYADVLIGAHLFTNVQEDEGRTYVYYGNDGGGLSLTPQQRRANDSGPIAREGASHSSDGFRVSAIGRSPFGRTRTRLEWEVKPRAQFLDGTGTSKSASWLDSGTAGVALNDLVSGLEPGDYHWRVRVLYDPTASPFAQSSRWFMNPWGGQEETDISLVTFLGGLVWEDRDGDGIRQPDEPRLGGIQVQLLPDGASTILDSAITDAGGAYHFEVDANSSYRVQVLLPAGFAFTLQDRGSDDTLDSDAHPVSGETAPISPPHLNFDANAWSAGLRKTGPCFSPDEAVYIATMRQDVNDNTVLDIQDPNQPDTVTGYNIYRSSNAALDPLLWPLLASDVVDQDQGTPNIQWTDTTGDIAPMGIWYYQSTAYNNACDAEGPR